MNAQPEAARARHLHLVPHGQREALGLSLRDLPWWTAADAAEFDVLTRALLKGVDWHLARCPVAKARSLEDLPFWCGHLSAAVEEVLEWRDMRESYSRALWLRALLEARR